MKRTPLKKASLKRARQLRAYRVLAPLWLAHYCNCQFPACWRESTQIHHRKGRAGELLVDTEWFMAICDTHHKWIEEHKNEARQRGFILYK